MSRLSLTLVMPFFKHLPMEVVLNIAITAVRICAIHDRTSAFNIAIVCRATFAATAPHLYRSLAVRWHRYDGGPQRGIFGNVLKNVRHLYISDKRLMSNAVLSCGSVFVLIRHACIAPGRGVRKLSLF